MSEPRLLSGDCRELMRDLADNSVDSIVTDPPAGISFMGKDWDNDKGGRDHWIAWMAEVAADALRVCRPGAHALVWALPRTSHWTATAWENAGWQARDRVAHVFGSGFPKSHNLSGEWEGWGTALKPAMEDWWLLRKPLEGTVAANVAKYGTGALNIASCRVEAQGRPLRERDHQYRPEAVDLPSGSRAVGSTDLGRWPANLIHDGSDEVLDLFAAFGDKGGGFGTESRAEGHGRYGRFSGATKGKTVGFGDTGTAARFFYCAKASKADRDAGLDDLPVVEAIRFSAQGQGPLPQQTPRKPVEQRNTHPTVKPTALMRYLCRLVTPPGGTILDPFMGSGSTGRGAILEGFRFIGIDITEDYVTIARKRIEEASDLLVPLRSARPGCRA